MSGRRTWAAGAALVLALTAGGLIWGFGLRGGTEGSPDDTCRGALAAEEAEAYFGGAELEFSGSTAEQMGQETEYCEAGVRGEEAGDARLRLNIRPAAAYRATDAAESGSAAPIGFGWNGSFDVSDRLRAGVLVDCAPLAGEGLLVLAETRQDVKELSEAQMLHVARFTTESARRAAERLGCEGPLGTRPSTVDRTPLRIRPVTRAQGTCRGVADERDAARLGLTTASERPAGRALTERCSLELPAKGHHVWLTAYYGPSAQQEMYLDGRYPGSVTGAVMRSHGCAGALGNAYFKFEEFPRPNSEEGIRSTVGTQDAQRLLTAFATASGARHGCPVP